MELRVFTEPQQGARFADQARFALHAEQTGAFTGYFRSDHFLAMGVSGQPGPTDTWTTLAGLALATSTIRLGTLVTSATFRHPGVLAVQVAQVDEMSGGRVEFGFGAGWFEPEHAALGVPFPATAGERFDRLEEQLRILTGLWGTPPGQTFSYAGQHYRLTDNPALPKPTQSSIPLILGGAAKARGAEMAARFADEFNVPFESPQECARRFARVAAACERLRRNPADIVGSAALVLCAGADDAAVARRAAVIGREVPELTENGLAGSPAQIVDKLGRYAEAGVQRVYLQCLDLGDLAHLDLVADQIAPQLG